MRLSRCLHAIAVCAVSLAFETVPVARAEGSGPVRPALAHRAVAANTPYLYAPITRIDKAKTHVEFALSEREGARVGALLPVRRPIAGGKLICELKVLLVDHRQAVGVVPKGLLMEGDEVVFQRSLAAPPPNMRDLHALIAEITFVNPAPGTSRRMHYGRVVEATWSSPLDVAGVQLELLIGSSCHKASYKSSDILQMRINGILLVPDPVKRSLLAAEILPLREKIRGDERRQQELRLAEIQANERVRLAQVRADEYQRRALDAAIAAREYAEREAREWKQRAEASMVAATATATATPPPDTDYVGRGLKFVGGFLTSASGVMAAYETGNISLQNGGMIVGGMEPMWSAIRGK